MKTKTVKADLHNHGAIAFSDYWLGKQSYAGKNILQLMAETCFKRNVLVCAVTSESDNVDDRGVIVRGSTDDRLGYLAEKYLEKLPRGYHCDKLGLGDVLVVEKDDKRVYFVNGQTVIVNDGGKRYDHLVIGSNRVPNFRNFHDTVKICSDRGLLNGLEHMFAEGHFGVGLEKGEEIVSGVDFVEVFNAQLRWNRLFGKIPGVRSYARTCNDAARSFAEKYKKPGIASSDAHRIKDSGIAGISFEHSLLDEVSGIKLLESIRKIVRFGMFEREEHYESAYGWVDWVGKFAMGSRK